MPKQLTSRGTCQLFREPDLTEGIVQEEYEEMSRSCRESRNASPTGSSDSFMSDESPEQKTIFKKPGPEVISMDF
jgi:hypothetical protein